MTSCAGCAQGRVGGSLPPGPSPGDRGAGIISSIFGLLMFLVFMLFSVQLLFSLYATSVITGAAYDAGRQVAQTGDVGLGQARFAGAVNSYDATVSFGFEGGTGFDDADVIIVRVTGANPTLLPDRFAAELPFANVDRTIRIRNEKFIE